MIIQASTKPVNPTSHIYSASQYNWMNVTQSLFVGRVSTWNQQYGYSPNVQAQQVRNFLKAKQVTVVREYLDLAKKGHDPNRKQLFSAVQLAKQIQSLSPQRVPIVSYCSDRLYRGSQYWLNSMGVTYDVDFVYLHDANQGMHSLRTKDSLDHRRNKLGLPLGRRGFQDLDALILILNCLGTESYSEIARRLTRRKMGKWEHSKVRRFLARHFTYTSELDDNRANRAIKSGSKPPVICNNDNNNSLVEHQRKREGYERSE